MKRLLLFFPLVVVLILGHTAFAIDDGTDILSGDIAVVGNDFNIYTVDFTDEVTHQVTDDASDTRQYQWPTWSNDGRLAYFCCDLRRTNDLNAFAYVSADGETIGDLVYEGVGETVIYAHWSPSNCTDGANCRDLALLINDVMRGGLGIEMVRNRDSESSSNRIQSGSPFYYNWNPEGTQLVFHRNNTFVEFYDLAQGDVTSRVDALAPGSFQAPAWSPVDDRIIFGLANEAQTATDLVLFENGEIQALVNDIQGLVSFLWSPDGTKIAYRQINNDGIGSVIVIDAKTGNVIGESQSNGTIAFFWAPDSQKIAYVSFDVSQSSVEINNQFVNASDQLAYQAQDSDLLLWSVFNLNTLSDTPYATFAPTFEMEYIFLYFDQFAPSHQIWSPDSTHIVYSEVLGLRGTDAVVNILDITQPGQSPVPVADGVLGIWSFE